MQHEPNDFSHHFEGTDIGIDITCWKQENRDYWIFFIPLELNDTPQDGLQKIGDEVSRLHFSLLERNGKLHFLDLTTKQGWYLDITEVRQGKLRFVGEGQGVAFLKEPVADLGILLDRR
jgi:hypothetical protein